MSADPIILNYASCEGPIDAPGDGEMRITLGPPPAFRVVPGILELVVGLLFCGVLAFFAVAAMPIFFLPLALLLALTLARMAYVFRTWNEPRLIEVRDGFLRTRHLTARGDSRTFPIWSITAIRLEGRWSFFPPGRVTALRLHLRLSVSTTLLDEIDCPELYKVAEALSAALKLEHRPPDPRDAELAEHVAHLRRRRSSI
jgi:hypothetical protein